LFLSFATRSTTRVLVALAVLAVGACGPLGSPSPSTTGAPIPVLGAENFYADLLAQIGGSRVTVSSILSDPSADPHAYEASPAAAKLVADAKVVIVNGIGYDDFMDKLLGASTKPDRIVIRVQDVLGAKDDVNVHVWYDPTTMPKVADAVATALAEIDPQSAAFLEQLMENFPGSRTLVVTNFRPEVSAAWMRHSYYQQLSLAPLSAEEAREMLWDLLGDDASLASLPAYLVERTGGNPFFVEEVVRALVERGLAEIEQRSALRDPFSDVKRTNDSRWQR